MITAKYFTYNGHSLKSFNLEIATFDTDNKTEHVSYQSTVSMVQAPGGFRVFSNGTELKTPPAIELTVLREADMGEVLPYERAIITSWLIGDKTFKPIKFSQADQTDITYYGIFTEVSTIFVDGYCRGFNLTLQPDSYFARGIPSVLKVENSTGALQTYNVEITNNSTIDGYVYPTIKFYGPSVSIVNKTDDERRAFMFTNLSLNEIMVVDNETKTITSSLGYPRLANFTTKNWLRLRKGINKLAVTCSKDVEITCPYYMLIGT